MTRSSVIRSAQGELALHDCGAPLRGLPGEHLRPLLARLLTPADLLHVVDPILADAHVEWSELGAERRRRLLLRARLTLELLRACSCLILQRTARASSRHAAIVAGSGSITLGLMFLMQSLIAAPEAPLTPRELETPLRVEVTRVATPPLQEPPSEDPRPGLAPASPELKLERRDPSPEDPRTTPDGSLELRFGGGDAPTLERVARLPLGGPAPQMCLPVARIEPRYPPRAVARGIEGSVRVALDIDPSGRVVDTTILESDSVLFDRAVEIAVRAWRYQPAPARLADESGDPAQVGCRRTEVMLTFELPD